jgi:hypothetical protein
VAKKAGGETAKLLSKESPEPKRSKKRGVAH